MPTLRPRLLVLPISLLLVPASSLAAIWIVAASGGDFDTIESALNAVDGPISLEAFPGESPVLDGTDVPGSDMIRIADRSFVRVVGFEIRDNLGVNDGSGIRILGSGSAIEIRGDVIVQLRNPTNGRRWGSVFPPG